MHEVGVEVVGLGAFKLTGYLRELLQRRNIHFESLYTVRTIKEVWLNHFKKAVNDVHNVIVLSVYHTCKIMFKCNI